MDLANEENSTCPLRRWSSDTMRAGQSLNKIDEELSDVKCNDLELSGRKWELIIPTRESLVTTRSLIVDDIIKRPEKLLISVNGRERKCTFEGGCVNLFLATGGLGAFVLPYYFHRAGLLPGIASIVIAAVATDVSCVMLISLATKARQGNYADVTDFFLTPTMRRISTWILIIWLIGICIFSFEVVLYSVDSIMHLMGCSDECSPGPRIPLVNHLSNDYQAYKIVNGSSHETHGHEACTVPKCPALLTKPIFAGFAFLTLLPMGTLENLHSLRWITRGGTIAFFFCLILFFAIVVYKTVWLANPLPSPHVVLATNLLGFFEMLPASFLAFASQFSILPIWDELIDRRQANRICHVVFLGLLLPIYLAFGVLGYALLEGHWVEEAGIMVWGNFGLLAGDAGLLIVSVISLFKLPLAFQCLRDSFFNEVVSFINWKRGRGLTLSSVSDRPVNQTLRWRAMISFLFLAAFAVLAVTVDLDLIVDLSGGFATVLIAFVIPGACYICWSMKDRISINSNIALLKGGNVLLGRRFDPNTKRQIIGVSAVIVGAVIGTLSIVITFLNAYE